MKKILFLITLITMAFSQITNTIAGWYNDNYYVPAGDVYSEGLIVADESTLAAESLAEGSFATHANWDVTNDFDDTGGNAAFIWSANQTSTLTQLQANLAVAGVGSRWYKFTYTLAVTTAFDGDAAATITTSFALSAVSLEIITAGTYTVYFQSAVTPTDFVISLVSGSDTEGTISYDDFSLKEITGGNIAASGLFTGGGSTGLKIDSDGVARLPKAIFLDEKASQETIVAGEGQFWVQNNAPTTPMFTDDTGDDYILSYGAAIYGTQGFADSSFTIAATQNVYSTVTNTGNNLYTDGIEVGDLLFAGDSIETVTAGVYEITWGLSYSGANTDLYHIEIFIDGVGQSGKGETQRDMSSANIGYSGSTTILSLAAGVGISIRIQNTVNNNDPTVYAGNLTVRKL